MRCSNPECGTATHGPSFGADNLQSTNLGVAAHITAASPNGPRYDKSLTLEQRASFENGIWLCLTCAARVDKSQNVQAYPKELLLHWKRVTEESTGTLFSTAAERRANPVRKITVSDFAGFDGTVSAELSKLTLFGKSQVLSMSVSEIFSIFSNKKTFKKIRQTSRENRNNTSTRAARALPPVGRIVIQLSDGRNALCVIKQHSTTLFVDGVRVTPFTEIFRAVEVIRSPHPSLRGRVWGPKQIADYFCISLSELFEMLCGDFQDCEQFFGMKYRKAQDSLQVAVPGADFFLYFEQISTGEKYRVYLDIAVRIATTSARFSPTLLLINGREISTLDPVGTKCLHEWLSSNSRPFQTIYDLKWPVDRSVGALTHYLAGVDTSNNSKEPQ